MSRIIDSEIIEKIDADQLQLIANIIPDGIFIVDDRGKICFANNMACSLFQYEAEELIGKPIEVLIPDQLKKEHTGLRKAFMAEPYARPMNRMKCYGVTSKGRPLDLGVMLQPFRDCDQLSVLCVVRDMHQQLQDEDDLYATRHAMQERVAEWKMVFFRASHELKAPLASIIGLTGLANDVSGKEDLLDLTRKIKYAAFSIESVVEKLEQAHTMMEGVFKYQEIQLRSFLSKMISVVQEHSSFNDIEFRLQCPAHYKLNTVPELLNIIINNLIENAAKYRRSGKKNAFVHIAAHLANQKIRLIVMDNGKGLQRSIKEELLDMSTKGEKMMNGGGLGLYLVRKAVNILGGMISCESSIGSGTTFKLTFPAK